MSRAIVILLNKIEEKDKKIKELEACNYNRFLQSIDISNYTFKGILVTKLYDFYIANKERFNEIYCKEKDEKEKI